MPLVVATYKNAIKQNGVFHAATRSVCVCVSCVVHYLPEFKYRNPPSVEDLNTANIVFHSRLSGWNVREIRVDGEAWPSGHHISISQIVKYSNHFFSSMSAVSR